MNVTITVTGDGQSLDQLYGWLRKDTDVARSGKLSARSTGTSGEMGALDVIDVVLSNTTGIAALAVGYATWRRSSSGRPRTTFTSGRTSVTVEGGSDDDIRRIIDTLSDELDAGSGGPAVD
ncbi:MAG TPA: hypothetical protein VGD67_21700 [Pseudonocardiaceae bacterium]